MQSFYLVGVQFIQIYNIFDFRVFQFQLVFEKCFEFIFVFFDEDYEVWDYFQILQDLSLIDIQGKVLDHQIFILSKLTFKTIKRLLVIFLCNFNMFIVQFLCHFLADFTAVVSNYEHQFVQRLLQVLHQIFHWIFRLIFNQLRQQAFK